MPGDIDDDISDRSHIDYDKIKVSIVDLKNLDEIMRWQLYGCGDGKFNSTVGSFEECDSKRSPPRGNHKYPHAKNWLRPDIWYDDQLRQYFTCSDICLR